MYGGYYGQGFGVPFLANNLEPKEPVIPTIQYKNGYVVTGDLGRSRYTLLLFEDPFLFLDEETANLLIAEQYSNDIDFKATERLTGVLSAGGYTLLLFEDPFLFLGEDDSALMIAEQGESNNVYKNNSIATGAFST